MSSYAGQATSVRVGRSTPTKAKQSKAKALSNDNEQIPTTYIHMYVDLYTPSFIHIHINMVHLNALQVYVIWLLVFEVGGGVGGALAKMK